MFGCVVVSILSCPCVVWTWICRSDICKLPRQHEKPPWPWNGW